MNKEENMTDYKIFDESLPDAYISELTEEELDVLIDEATEEHLRLEKEIDNLIWKDTPQIGDDGEPVNKVWPSEFSYLPIFYRDMIAVKPGLEKRSEERRVGKECRSRWAADHEKKNKKSVERRRRDGCEKR